MSNQTEWRWADPTGQQRLVREDELRAALKSGVIPPNAPVWTRGWVGWKPAHEVPELTGKAPAPQNGTNGDVPPPPNFIVAAQDAFEGKPAPAPAGPAEPPPPPRYVPLGAQSPKPAPVASAKPPPTTTSAKPPPTPATKPQTKPPPLPPGARNAAKKSSAPPPLPAAAKRSQPTPAPPKVVTTTAPMKTNLAKTAPSPGTTTKPMPQAQQSQFKHTQRPPAGVAPPPESLPPSGRSTLQIAPAPPPMPKLDPLPTAPKPAAPAEPSSKYPTLLMFDDAPAPPTTAPATEPSSEEAPPIVVPPNEPSAVTNAVTRPPPWGEGAVEMDTTIPKSPPMPGAAAAAAAKPPEPRPSDAPPRPFELSSSDLTSDARIAVVKAAPLAPAERPHATMLGIGPDALAQNRAALEKAVQSPPPAPLSASDVASTTKWPAQDENVPEAPPTAPMPPPSGAKLHDLRELAAQRARGVTDAARRGWADLRERTKDKPRWFLPVIAGSAACIVILLFAEGIRAIAGSGSSATEAPSSSSASPIAPVTATAPTVTAPKPARPMVCTTAGEARSVAPKALVASGVEVVDVGGKVALGFAAAPKEATLELVDPSNGASLGSIHQAETARVRRVVALDASKMAVDVDRKGDPLQGRRTLRASTPIDLGATDDGLAWAPLGSDKSVKLWSLPDADQPVQALRGEPLPNGAGFAVAFRHAGGIWFGSFGGTPPGPLGSLLHVDGLGPKIGSPAIAASGDEIMVAWADRATKDDPWSVRYATFKSGDTAVKAKTFSLSGGAPERAMSPALAPLGAGRFLFLWTECPEGGCRVRGTVFNADGRTSEPFTASADGVNAGQGQAAVLADGRGVVAFLAAAGHHVFEVHAAPIHCAEK